MKILLSVLSILILTVTSVNAFEIGKLKVANFAEFYNEDSTDIYRIELVSRVMYKDWPGHFKIKYYGNISNDFDEMEKYQFKSTYAHRIFKTPFYGLGQYTYLDKPKKNSEVWRFGIGVKF